MSKFLISFLLINLTNCLYTQINKYQLDSFMDSLYDKQLFNGMLLIADSNNEYMYCKGISNFNNNNSIKLDNAINIASISKLYISIIVLDMVNENKIDLNAKVVKYLKEVPDTSITIIDLINHTSNLSVKIFDKTKLKLLKDNSKENVYRFILENCFNNINGKKRYEYAPENTFLLALIIEKLEQHPFSNVIEGFFKKLNLSNKTFYSKESYLVDTNLLYPSIEDKNLNEKNHEGYYNSVSLTDNMIGGKGVFTTLSDIKKFGNYILNMPKESKDIIYNNCFDNNSFKKCLGFELRENPNHEIKMLSHGGYVPGCKTVLNLDENKKIIYFIVNTNERGSNREEEFSKFTINLLANKIRKIYISKP